MGIVPFYWYWYQCRDSLIIRVFINTTVNNCLLFTGKTRQQYIFNRSGKQFIYFIANIYFILLEKQVNFSPKLFRFLTKSKFFFFLMLHLKTSWKHCIYLFLIVSLLTGPWTHHTVTLWHLVQFVNSLLPSHFHHEFQHWITVFY